MTQTKVNGPAPPRKGEGQNPEPEGGKNLNQASKETSGGWHRPRSHEKRGGRTGDKIKPRKIYGLKKRGGEQSPRAEDASPVGGGNYFKHPGETKKKNVELRRGNGMGTDVPGYSGGGKKTGSLWKKKIVKGRQRRLERPEKANAESSKPGVGPRRNGRT